MNNKCEKYESLFLFADEETLQKHIAQCEDCAREHEKMQKVSALVKEAKPEYEKRERFFSSLKIACVLFLFVSTGAVLQSFNPIINQVPQSAITSSYSINDDESIIASMGLPTDDYGLLRMD